MSSGPAQIGVIADDLTGALDTGVQFRAAGLRCRVLLEFSPTAASAQPGAEVLVVNTETRSASPETARERVLQAAAWLHAQGVQHYFKKMDSLLRGPWRAELASLSEFLGGREVLLCPAYPSHGRRVRGGEVWLDGTTSVGTLLTAGCAWHVPDADTDADLVRLARAARERNLLPCGSAGLAAAWAGTFAAPSAEKDPPLQRPHCRRVLVVAGSMHPTTRQQLAVLREWLPSGEADGAELLAATAPVTGAGEDPQVSEALAWEAAARHRQLPYDGMILTGGETASRVLRHLGARDIELRGEVLSGMPYGVVRGGAASGLRVITKSGAFGKAPDLRFLVWFLQGG